jgi:hypothetical protein
MMVIFQDELGLVFYPPEQIASLTPAFPDRWRVVASDGSLGYRPNPPDGPWVALGDSRVAPQWLKDGIDPAGFYLGSESLRPVEFGACQGVPFWAWEKGQWLTDQGAIDSGLSQAEVLATHPEMRLARRGLCFNLRRPRRLLRAKESGDVLLVYDNGRQHRIAYEGLGQLRESLGLTHLFALEPHNPDLWTYHLRDFPFELNLCDGPRLRQLFSNKRQLIANFLWQNIYYRRRGQEMDYGKQIRGFWYMPLYPALFRAGFVTVRDKEKGRLAYEEMLGKMVGEDRLFDYRELGFEEESSHFRHYGPRPVVLMVEKESVLRSLQPLLEELGICALCTGGTPRLIGSEAFARGLLPLHSRVRLVAYVDYDPGGWWAARTLLKHLARFGVECQGEPVFVVSPERFSTEELSLYTLPLDEDDPRAEGWFAQTGGIGGQRLTIHANWLRPAARVKAALQQVLSDQ